MKKTIIIIGSIIVVLGVIGAFVTYHVQKRLFAAPRIHELTLLDTVFARGVSSNPVICQMSFKEGQEGLVGCYLAGYKYLSGAVLYRADWEIKMLNEEDTLLGDSLLFYYNQRDPIVCATRAPEVQVQFIPRQDKPSNGRFLISCYEEAYFHQLFAQPMMEIGIYTSNRGLVILPLRPETSEQMAERYALILEYFARH